MNEVFDDVKRTTYKPPMSNADHIRSMTDEELEYFLCKTLKTDCGKCFAKEYCYNAHNGFEDWLKQPYEGD